MCVRVGIYLCYVLAAECVYISYVKFALCPSDCVRGSHDRDVAGAKEQAICIVLYKCLNSNLFI